MLLRVLIFKDSKVDGSHWCFNDRYRHLITDTLWSGHGYGSIYFIFCM